MSLDLVIHATVTVRGGPDDLAACRGRIARALEAQAVAGEVSEHHGPGALAYDLKVKGGLPFPVFVEVSQARPSVTITIEWVNPDAGQRGVATIAAGRLSGHDIAPLENQARAPVCVRIAPDGRLALACVLVRSGPDECRGYAIGSDRDAAFRAVRLPGGAMALVATEGAAEWAVRWRMIAGGAVAREAVDPPEAIPDAEYAELERLAREFAAEWVWLADGPEQEVAIERERLARRGHAGHAANLRSSALARIEARGRKEGGVLVYDAVPEDLRWAAELLTRCWLGAT